MRVTITVRGNNIRTLLVLATFCVVYSVCALLIAPSAAFAAKTQASLPYSQVFITDNASVSSEFSYTLVADAYTPDTPMPVGSVGDTYTFNVDGTTTGSIIIDTTTTPVGTYTYTIQDASTHQPNYSYDQRTYTVKVYVDGTHTVTTIVRDSDATKVAQIEFDPSYTAPQKGSVTVKKGIQSSDVRLGGSVVYTLTVTSVGQTDAVGVWVKDHLPQYTTYVSSTKGGTFVPDANRGSVNWFIERLAPGQSTTLYLTVSLDADLPANVSIDNIGKFEVTGTENPPDFNDEPNSAPDSNGGETNVATVSRSGGASNMAKTGDVSGLSFATLLAIASAASTMVVMCLRRTRRDLR